MLRPQRTYESRALRGTCTRSAGPENRVFPSGIPTFEPNTMIDGSTRDLSDPRNLLGSVPNGSYRNGMVWYVEMEEPVAGYDLHGAVRGC